jgi:N-succinyldiaminopimelate aminotransferase
MNPRLGLLHPYPFERLRKLLANVTAPQDLRHINLSIGEPQHPTPAFIKQALAANFDALARYPQTVGTDVLRDAIVGWLSRRHSVDALTRDHVLPTQGSREALFAIAQALIDPLDHEALVVCPNPFYQIYEGAALLAGAKPFFLNTTPANGLRMDWSSVPEAVWERVRVAFVCSPGNPTGRVVTLDEWNQLFELSERYAFVIVADECYSEIYFEEGRAPLGALAAARQLGQRDFRNLVVMGSLSKRSNVPGMRSGFAAGDPEIMRKFLLYRTYHGSAMGGTVQAASVAAWSDELHVVENRRLYREKFDAFYDLVNPALPLQRPQAAFYYWTKVPASLSDEAFAVKLLHDANISVLPGSYLSRDANGVNPGAGFVRIALVSSVDDAVEGAQRIRRVVEAI